MLLRAGIMGYKPCSADPTPEFGKLLVNLQKDTAVQYWNFLNASSGKNIKKEARKLERNGAELDGDLRGWNWYSFFQDYWQFDLVVFLKHFLCVFVLTIIWNPSYYFWDGALLASSRSYPGVNPMLLHLIVNTVLQQFDMKLAQHSR